MKLAQDRLGPMTTVSLRWEKCLIVFCCLRAYTDGQYEILSQLRTTIPIEMAKIHSI